MSISNPVMVPVPVLQLQLGANAVDDPRVAPAPPKPEGVVPSANIIDQ